MIHTLTRDGEEMPKKNRGGINHPRKAEDDLTKEEWDAVEYYVSGEGMWINQYLRGRGDFGELSESEKEFLRDLDKATTHGPTAEDVLYRSVDASVIFGGNEDALYALQMVVGYGDTQRYYVRQAEPLLNAAIGREITEKGFMSTTKDFDIAKDFGSFTGSDNPIVMKIHTNGAFGVDAGRFEVADDPQKEVLLQRGLKYRVNRVYGEDRNVVVDVSIVR